MRPTTSASNLFRRALCPGSARLEEGLPDDDSEQSREGTLLHSYAANPELVRQVLKPNQRDLLELSDRLVKQATEIISQEIEDESACEQITERQYYGVVSGKPDLVFVFPKDLVVVDRKFGYKIVERAELNLQLRSYGVIVYDDQKKKPQRVFVAIVQPRVSYSERLTIAKYEPEDIEASRVEIQSILDASSKPDAPLHASEEACTYCKAKLICDEYKAKMLVPAVLTPDKALSKRAREAYLAQRLAELTDEELDKVMVAKALAKMINEPANDEVRKRITAGGMKNYKLGKASEVSEIVDAQRAISLLEIAGIATKEESLSLCSLPIGGVKEKYREAHPGMTWDRARDKINKVLASVIETHTQKEKVLRK